jgi:H+-translocating NAD(P) transhydrogenase subunit alpha
MLRQAVIGMCVLTLLSVHAGGALAQAPETAPGVKPATDAAAPPTNAPPAPATAVTPRPGPTPPPTTAVAPPRPIPATQNAARQMSRPTTRPVMTPPDAGKLPTHTTPPEPNAGAAATPIPTAAPPSGHGSGQPLDFMSMVFVFMLSTFIGVGVIRRVSRLLHTPLMSITNAISAIAVVGSIMVTGGEKYPTGIKVLGWIALAASMTNIVSGFMITDRMLKMFKTREGGKA